MRQLTCVLLDLDGTLIDSKPGIVASFNAALRRSDIARIRRST